ncbi:FAD-dependent oxidoreductase [Candidatus Nomurabacteria bacterium]|nr:FAD-dependent oxidoreductase [Candidatus Nomurabacteria bacterium]
MIYDLAILGGGPAGVAAGVYASRKKLKTIFVTKDYQSQSAVSDGIENWIGDIQISGQELAKKLENHLKAYAGDIVDIKEGEIAIGIEKTNDGFKLKTDKGEYEVKTILVATGSHRRKLTAPGADQYEHKGITYCASCDGPLFTDKDVVVIGGGNAGFETAAQLLAYTKSVTLLQSSSEYKADPITVEAVLKDPKMTGLKNVETLEIIGDKFVTGIKIKDKITSEEKTLDVQGIFVEIGALPNTDFLEGVVDLTDYKQVKVDPRNQRTSIAGIWAAGDCTDGLYHQNNIAAGDAVKALEDIYIYLKAQ